MEKLIREFIFKEAQKHAIRYHLYHNYLHIDYLRNKQRLSTVGPKLVHVPDCWNVDRKFNPFYVLKNLDAIVRSITKKIQNGTYSPNSPYTRIIPKKGGGTRSICMYQIPDAAISNLVYSNLLAKNKHRFSSLSYAYRNDKNVHFAIQDIALDFSQNSRHFIAEFDFSDFFGSIKHSYLRDQFDQNGFYISELERKIIEAFLSIGEKGVPQGTSISLFLANLSCWRLDKELEKVGVRFARYADDTVIWSNSYEKICSSFNVMERFSKESQVQINFKKSAGISLLMKPGMPSELQKTKSHVDFLGYAISVDKISIKSTAVRKIKKQISYLLYRNLIQPYISSPVKGQIVPNRGVDASFVTAMMQVRRYLYGGLNEVAIKRYLRGELSRIQFKGVMSYYPLVNDGDQLEELDKWLVCTILKILRKREKLLKSLALIKPTYIDFPFNLNHENVIEACRMHLYKGKVGLTQIPSFLRIHKAIHLGLVNEGLGFVINPGADVYNYDD